MTNEPTTGEIVRALRCCADVNSICGDACPAHLDEAGCRTVLMQNAADCLESQERSIEEAAKLNEKQANAIAELHEQIAEQNDEIQMARDGIDDTVKILTARAEQAEKERDAAIAVIGIQAEKLKESHVVLCNICEFEDMIGCVHKSHCDGYQLFKYRGLPQDGEGK